MLGIVRAVALALGGLLLAAAPVQAAPSAPPTAVREAPAGAALTRPDLETWLDGFLPFALQRGDIAGAQVVVVKDGQVLLAKGYGLADVATRRPMDPQTVLVRPGSISKLFTWTAVMQLAEAGRVDLDADVNRYLDFKIPPRLGRPITLRDLMTHTSGFEERFKSVVAGDRRQTPTLEGFLKSWTPTRIFPPGTTPAYSNYGATLAGYIVQRVSGERFEDYVRAHIFLPLGMERATFEQDPHPGDGRATTYVRASGPAHGFEFVGDAPAGALSITGADMGRFMLAHLGDGQWDGRSILRPETARRMHAPVAAVAPPFNSMALGFYGQDRNGRRIIGHAGDLVASHADLRLLPDEHVGVFFAVNSWGRDDASSAIREALSRGFLDRYYPAPATPPPVWRDGRAAGAALVGSYEASRRADDTFASLAGLLQQGRMQQRGDGALVFSRFLEPNGQPSVWRQVAPDLWRNADGSEAMRVERGPQGVRLVSSQIPPIVVWTRPPAWRDAAWNAPLFLVTLGILALSTVAWVIAPWVRRTYGRKFELEGRRALAHRLSRTSAAICLAFLLGWLAIVAAASTDPAVLASALDPWLIGLRAVGVLGLALGAASVWNLVLVWRERPRRWWGRLANLALVGAWAATVWFAAIYHLLGFSVQY